MRTGDVLLHVGDRKAHTFRSILEEVEDKKKGASVKLQVQRGPEILEFTVSPVRQPVNVTLSGLVHERPTWETQIPFPESLEVAVIHTGRTITRIVQTLGSLFRGAVAPKHLGGIITIFRVSKDQSKVGLMRGLLFLAMVSINLAILNILPIPVLDGGWLMFLTIEKIKGSPVSERAMAYFQWAGLIFILGLMGFVTYNDIVRLF
jgi:regulator of sigma E protease